MLLIPSYIVRRNARYTNTLRIIQMWEPRLLKWNLFRTKNP